VTGSGSKLVTTSPAPCPKCGAEQTAGLTACPKCGLATDRMAKFASQLDQSTPQALLDAWAELQDHWEDLAHHDEMLRLVTQNDAYAWAAARYRTREDDIGRAQLARVRKAAEAQMMTGAVARKASTPTPYRATTGLLVLLIVVTVGGLIYAAVVRGRKATPTPTPNGSAGNYGSAVIDRSPTPTRDADGR